MEQRVKSLVSRFRKSVLNAGLFSTTFLFSHSLFAEDLAPLTGAVDWVTTTLANIALTVLGLQIMFRLWQVSQGQKEWSEVVKPILITAAIVAVPIAIPLMRAAMK